MIWIAVLATALVAYLVGSFPSGYLAGRAHGVDLRKEGSGNIGATNALRVLGKRTGYLVFAADIFKGWLSVMVAFFIGTIFAPAQTIPFGVLGAICGVVGHMFPVWLGFQGGKGIATSGGVMLALFPIEVFIFGLAAWLILFFTTRYVSIASIAAALALPIGSAIMVGFGRCDWLRVIIASIMCVLAIWRHKSNIQRLLAGTEKKFEKKQTSTPSEYPHV
jgi:glycerol-3-phosphate acyltransferase PlsY